MPKLSSLKGKFNQSGTYKLKEYDQKYLKPLTNSVKELQSNVKKVAKQFHNTVMVEGKWYDECAAEFAKWWNDDSDKTDGVQYLNRISTVAEEFVRITAVDVCKEMVSLKSMSKSANKHPYISKFGKGNVYVDGIENITRKSLGAIAKTECSDGVAMTANKENIEKMIKGVSNAFDEINTQIGKIEKLINTHLIQGNTISFKGLNSTVLKSKVKQVKNCLNQIQDNLYKQLEADKENTNLTTKMLQKALETDYTKTGSSTTSKSGSGATGTTAGVAGAAGATVAAGASASGWASPTSTSTPKNTDGGNLKLTTEGDPNNRNENIRVPEKGENPYINGGGKGGKGGTFAPKGKSNTPDSNNATHKPGENPYTGGGNTGSTSKSTYNPGKNTYTGG